MKNPSDGVKRYLDLEKKVHDEFKARMPSSDYEAGQYDDEINRAWWALTKEEREQLLKEWLEEDK